MNSHRPAKYRPTAEPRAKALMGNTYSACGVAPAEDAAVSGVKLRSRVNFARFRSGALPAADGPLGGASGQSGRIQPQERLETIYSIHISVAPPCQGR